jgi:hypothetical protein
MNNAVFLHRNTKKQHYGEAIYRVCGPDVLPKCHIQQENSNTIC